MSCVTQKNQSQLDTKTRFPTSEYTRDEFYTTTENLRYTINFSLTNGQQAEDIPIGIEDLIEFIGDVKMLLEDHEISVSYTNHTYWTVKVQTDEHLIRCVSDKTLEKNIEQLATEHGIALQKKVGFSGRGYTDTANRIITVSYKFGSYTEDPTYWITNAENPTSYIEWVGGEIGKKADLKPSPIQVESVKNPSIIDSLSKLLPI